MPASGPLVSVLIPTFNAGRFVTTTIRSALRQTLEDFEVIVLDDGSTDDTVDRVRAFRDSRLHLIQRPHSGAPAALNAGLALARGRYIALLDHDDVWLPSKLARHAAFFEAHPDAAVTFSWCGLIDEQDRPITVHPSRWQGSIGFRHLLEDYVVGSSSTLVLRRATVEGAGGFDVSLPRCHDFDLTLRIAFADANSVQAVPEPLTLYRRHPGQMSRDWRAMHAEWDAVFEKCRAMAPLDTAAVEPRARSNINRYFAYLAYEAGEFKQARQFVREALKHDPLAFLRDMRNWRIVAACAAEAALPASLHRRLERSAGINRA